jgi:hypothetical protein
MREDTKKRLERAIFIERMKKLGIGLGVLAILGAVIAYQNFDLKVTNTQVAGTVTEIDPLVSKTNSADGEMVQVKLDSGQLVNVLALKKRNLKVGDHIDVVEHHHATGRVTHTLK